MCSIIFSVFQTHVLIMYYAYFRVSEKLKKVVKKWMKPVIVQMKTDYK